MLAKKQVYWLRIQDLVPGYTNSLPLSPNCFTLYNTVLTFNDCKENPFENIVGKE